MVSSKDFEGPRSLIGKADKVLDDVQQPFFLKHTLYKDVSFDTSRSPEKCIKIAKTAGNKAFLAVFAVLFGVQLTPSEHSRGMPDAGIWTPA